MRINISEGFPNKSETPRTQLSVNGITSIFCAFSDNIFMEKKVVVARARAIPTEIRCSNICEQNTYRFFFFLCTDVNFVFISFSILQSHNTAIVSVSDIIILLYTQMRFIDLNSHPFSNDFSIYFNASRVQTKTVFAACYALYSSFFSICIRIIIILYDQNQLMLCPKGIYSR